MLECAYYWYTTAYMSVDTHTAQAFATSWNNLPEGSVYTRDQFEDWMAPLSRKDVEGKTVLELGCGNASLMVHMAEWRPGFLEGVDLGDSVLTAEKNMVGKKHVQVTKADLVAFTGVKPYDLVYCIGVLHHLQEPSQGFASVVRNTKPGGRFHCWVYAREGNNLIVWVVDPLRKIVSRLPWWFTKYAIATPLAGLFYVYAKLLAHVPHLSLFKALPLYEYALWIAKREYAFFRHVAFDQLVTPQTAYIPRTMIEGWLASYPEIDQASTYVIARNGNSWKFGGKKRAS
jgi:ubiquinone/menaquinone biosynthesis C-methylase UbiE